MIARWRHTALTTGRRALLAAGLVLIVLIPTWWIGGEWYRAQLLAEQRARVSATVALHGNALSIALQRRFAPLDAMYAFVQAEITDGQLTTHFESFAEELHGGAREIRSLALAPDGVMQAIYPLAGNESVLGYVPAEDSRAQVRADVQRALATGKVVVTGPIELIQGGVGLIARRAVIREDGSVWGLVNVALNLPPILEEAGLASRSDGLTLAVHDELGRLVYGSSEVWAQDPVLQPVTLPEGTWRLAGVPEQGWAATIRAPLVLFQTATLTTVLLLAGLTFVTVRQQSRLTAAVREQTKDITRINEQLERDLAERRRVEAELRTSEERYRTLARNFPNGAVLLFDRDLRYLLADGAGLPEVGLSTEGLVGKTIWELFAPEVTALLEPHYRAALAGTSGMFEVPFAERTYLLHTLPLRDESGAILAGMAVTQNITERKEAEQALRASEARNRALVNAIPDLMLRMSRSGVYLDFHAERASDVIFPPDRLVGMNIRDTSLAPDLVDGVLASIQTALATGQVQTLEYSLELPDGPHDYEARSVASGQDEVVVIVRDITERKRAEAALARWAHVFEHAEWGVAVGSADGRRLELLNPAYARMHGYTVDELTGQAIGSLFAPGTEAELNGLIRAANETGHAVIESTHVRKDGSLFPVLVDLTAVKDAAGRVLYRVANVQDITERKRVETHLRESEAELRAVFTAMRDVILVLDRDGRYLKIAPTNPDLLYRPTEALLGKRLHEVMPPDLADAFLGYIRRALATGETVYAEYSLPIEGQTMWFSVANSPMLDDRVVVVARDITERKQAEALLAEKEEQYRNIFEATSDGLFVNDLFGNLVDFNPAAAHMHGYTVDEFRQLQPPQFIHPDSFGLFNDYMETVRAGRIFRARAVDVRKDGSLLPVEVLGTSFTYRGQPHTLGVVRDVTEQVRAYELLEQRVEERTRELTTLLDVSRSIASTLDLDPLLALILDDLKVFVDYTSARINTLDRQALHVRAARGRFPQHRLLGISFPLSSQIAQEIVVQRRPVVIPDVRSADDPWAAVFRADGADHMQSVFAQVRSWMGVPLIVKDQVIGSLALDHEQPDFYDARAAELAMALANQVAVAIENARLFEAAQRRAEQFRVISELGYRITSILAVDELLGQTVRLIRETFGYYHIHVGLIEGDQVVFKCEAGLWCDEPQCARCEGLKLRVGHDGLSGRVAASGEPILVHDVARDPRFISIDPGQAGSALVLPLKVQGRVIGVLTMESSQLNAFDAGDVAVLQSFANQTAVAIENARLYEQSQQLAALQERQKLARELHDSVSQALFGIALGARTARAQLEREPDRAAEPLDYVLSLSEAALSEMRALIFELRPESLAAEGLVAALEKQAASLRARHRIAVHTRLGSEPDVALEVKQALYRIAQEALHNIVKHARANRVDLSLLTAEGGVTLNVRDDGRGFDPGGSYPGHLGLHSMRERAESLGGAFEIQSQPGQGSWLSVQIPIDPPAD